MYDFDPQGEDELAIVEGERLFVVRGAGGSDDPDWIKVRKLLGGSEGVVPASYIQVSDGFFSKTKRGPVITICVRAAGRRKRGLPGRHRRRPGPRSRGGTSSPCC